MRALLASPCSRVSARRFRVAPRRRLAPAHALPETDRVGVVPEYGDPTFDAAVREAFDSGRECVADAEQARTLWDHGWDVLDVRDAHEIEFHGDFPNPPVGTIGGVFETIVVSGPHKVRAVPIVTSAAYRFDPDAGSKVFANKTRNPGFEAAVSAAFPNKAEAKIIVSCSTGGSARWPRWRRSRRWGTSASSCCGGGSTCTTDAGRKSSEGGCRTERSGQTTTPRGTCRDTGTCPR